MRLIDCIILEVNKACPGASHTALSYVWGSKSSNHTAAAVTFTHQLSMITLPKVIVDAIKVTKGLACVTCSVTNIASTKTTQKISCHRWVVYMWGRMSVDVFSSIRGDCPKFNKVAQQDADDHCKAVFVNTVSSPPIPPK